VIVKRGDSGALLFHDSGVFATPAFPLDDVIDPTGAGDTFAGGLMGYLASQPGEIDDAVLRRAMAYGTAFASFNVEGFGGERLYELDRTEVDERVAALESMTRF